MNVIASAYSFKQFTQITKQKKMNERTTKYFLSNDDDDDEFNEKRASIEKKALS